MTDRALKLSPVEKLARRMCWLEFTPPRTRERLGYTEAEYWSKIAPSRRDRYMEQARRFLWLTAAYNTDARFHAIVLDARNWAANRRAK